MTTTTSTTPPGRVAVVTGAGRGIGLAITRALLDAGHVVVGADLVVDELHTLAARDDPPGRLQPIRADLREPTAAPALIDAAVERFGRLDVLVNNAADIGHAQAFDLVDDQTWDDHLSINLLAAIRTTRAAIPHLRRLERSSVVMIGSDAGETPAPEFAPYSVTKAALAALSKTVSKAYGGDGIRCNLIAPGLTRTHATAGLIEDLTAQYGDEQAGIAAFTSSIGQTLPRVAEAEEIADLTAFLVGPGGQHITGAVLRVDGGTVPTI